MKVKLFGKRIKATFRNYTLGVDFVNKTPQQNLDSIISSCDYDCCDEIGEIEMLTDLATGREIVEIIELNLPQIPTYIKLNGCSYETEDLTYDVEKGYYTTKLKNYVVQYADPEEKKIACENLAELNRLIKERNDKIKKVGVSSLLFFLFKQTIYKTI